MLRSVRLRGHADANSPSRGSASSGPSCTPALPAAPTRYWSWATRCCAPPAIPSVAHLSLEPTDRRGWGSTYDALASGRIDPDRLRELLAACLQPTDPLVFAVDVTTWPRCDAECSPARGRYYHPSRHSAGQPIIAGWAYQWVCQLSFDRDSWTAPVDAARLHPLDDTDQSAAVQVRALLRRAIALSGAARISAVAGRAGLAGHRAKTLWLLSGPAQGQPIRGRHPLPGHQEAHHQAQDHGRQDRQGRLTGRHQTTRPPMKSAASPTRRRVKSQAKHPTMTRKKLRQRHLAGWCRHRMRRCWSTRHGCRSPTIASQATTPLVMTWTERMQPTVTQPSGMDSWRAGCAATRSPANSTSSPNSSWAGDGRRRRTERCRDDHRP